MADTYTQALKARKIEAGAYDPDWSERLNEDVVDIFDAGISGQVEIDIGSNTTYTLAAMVNGTLSDSHYWRLNIVGTPASAVTFTIPASVTPSKEYLIDNQTGQALTVKYAATNGVTVQDGDVIRVLCDGTTVVELPATPRFGITAAEIAAGVTPTNYFVGELDSAKRYGAFGDAITEDHQAIQREINVAQQYADGADLDLGRGRYMLGSGLTITGSRIHLRGRGKYATQLIYAPSANGTALNIANGASRIDQGSIRDLSILSTDTTYEKVAIALRSVGGYVIERVLVSGSGVDKWNGGASGSTCLKINGRDTSGLSNLELFGQRPIVIGTDPNEPSISIDHFNFHNLYMIAVGAFPTVEIQTGVNLTQVSFTGHQAWVGGNNGLQWIDTTTSAVSNGLLLENVRFESTTDVTKYMVRIEHNTRLGGLTIRGGQGGDRNGFYLRKIDNVHLEDFWFNTTLEALNADATVRKITGINCNWFAGSTKTLAGQRLMLGSPTNPNTGALPPTFIYDESANADDLFNIGRTTTFTVTRNSFTEVLGGGTITSTGSYSKIGKRVEFAIRVVCAGGATIASVANTSFFGGLPPGTFDGVCQVSRYDNTTSLGNGWVQASGANVLTPVWGAAANATYLISGSYEIA